MVTCLRERRLSSCAEKERKEKEKDLPILGRSPSCCHADWGTFKVRKTKKGKKEGKSSVFNHTFQINH